MFSKLKLLSSSLLLSALVLLSGCQQPQSPTTKTIKVGTIAGPETMLAEKAKEVAQKKYGLDIEVVEFTDFAMPNTALNDGSIDANAFQHLPYLQAAIKAKSYHLTPIAKTFIYPMGMYSKKITELSKIPDNATIAIPNDPSNEARALLLLQTAGLITVAKDDSFNVHTVNITHNPKQLKFKSLEAAQLPRILDDVDVAVINTNYAVPAGLSHKNALFLENKDSPYANLIVVREKEKNDPKFVLFVKAMNSEEVLKTAKELFGEQAIPAW